MKRISLLALFIFIFLSNGKAQLKYAFIFNKGNKTLVCNLTSECDNEIMLFKSVYGNDGSSYVIVDYCNQFKECLFSQSFLFSKEKMESHRRVIPFKPKEKLSNKFCLDQNISAYGYDINDIKYIRVNARMIVYNPLNTFSQEYVFSELYNWE